MVMSFQPDAFAEYDHSNDGMDSSVVKVFTTYRNPSFYQPWQFKPRKSSYGSGVVMENHQILTNGHLVNNAVFVQVRKAGDPKKYIAYVVSAGHQSDLAILKVKDESFFEGTVPARLGDLPNPRESVSVYGYPRGGSEISITKGIVSRIELIKYTHSGLSVLGAQIDAAINPGNSGGPVVMGGKVVGIAMQSMRGGENIGYVIPAPVIKHFLKDISDGQYDGLPYDGVLAQLAENDTMRRFYKMPEGTTGVVTVKSVYGSSAFGIIQKGDVLTAIDGVKIANDNSVQLKDNLRVSADYIVQRKQVGEEVTFSILREGENLDVKIKLKPLVTLTPKLFDARPSYIIYGGIVFTPLTRNFLMEWGGEWRRKAPQKLLNFFRFGQPEEGLKQVVVLRSVLAHDVNAGYHNMFNLVITEVNGQEISDMADLKKALAAGDGPFVVIRIDSGETIVLDRGEVEESEEELLRLYGVSSPVSGDLG